MSKNYLREDQNRRLELLNSLGVKEEDLKRDVEIFRSWAEKEQHLPQDLLYDDSFIERLLLNNKFRIEQAKVKYDNYFTSKSVCNFFFHNIENVVPSKIPVVKFPLRKLTEEGRRIIFVCMGNVQRNGHHDFLECIKFHMAISEIINKYSFCDGRIVVLDFDGLKSGFFKNFDVLMLHKHLKMIKNCYSGRIHALHIVNMTNFVNILLSGIKMIFQKELSSKIKIHDSWESLHREIPQKLLPKDYGGDDVSIAEYLEIWDDIIKEEETFLKNLRYQVPDESLRRDSSYLNSSEFGVEGTFKKLNID